MTQREAVLSARAGSKYANGGYSDHAANVCLDVLGVPVPSLRAVGDCNRATWIELRLLSKSPLPCGRFTRKSGTSAPLPKDNFFAGLMHGDAVRADRIEVQVQPRSDGRRDLSKLPPPLATIGDRKPVRHLRTP